MTSLAPSAIQEEAVRSDAGATDNSEGMAYLDTFPHKLMTVYLPLMLIMIVLIFQFYWIALTAIKPDEQLVDMERYNPFWVVSPTLKHIKKFAQARREATELSGALIDIDRFESVNDTFGHGVGDLVLQQVVATVKSELRASDYIGRIGGEEFAVNRPGFAGGRLV